MEQIGDVRFIAKEKKWAFSLKENEYKSLYVRIDHDNNLEVLANYFVDPVGKLEEKIKKTKIYQNVMYEIEAWEKELTKRIIVSEVKYITHFKERNQTVHIVSFRIKEGLPYLEYVEEKKEYELKNIKEMEQTQITNRNFFLVPIVKTENNYKVANGYKMVKTKYSGEKEETHPLKDIGSGTWKMVLSHQEAGSFYTHRTFEKNILDQVLKDPSIKLRKMFWK